MKQRTSHMRLAIWAVALMAVVVGGVAAPGAASAEDEKHVLKIASLAPENSSWAKSIKRMGREIQKKTDGEVVLKLYPGGVMGDEPAMVRKMRTGQISGAAVTNVGLGEIEPKILVLQLPLIFKNWDEVDYVRNKMSDTFRGLLDEKGFSLLTWGDVGFNYVFSKKEPIHKPSDIQSAKTWVWESDPIMNKIMDVAEVNAVPLTVTDVLPSLTTGVIDAFTNSPYAAVSLQWSSRAKYVTNLKVAVIVGGIVLSNEALEKLPEEYRKVVREVASERGEKLLAQIREDNREAIKTIQKTGVEVVQPKNMKAWQKIAKQTREELAGELFPASLLEEMQKHLKEYRE